MHGVLARFAQVEPTVLIATDGYRYGTRRIERAMTLLRGRQLTVTEVCFAVGYSSLGTFSTRFAELVGVPPSTYRRQTSPGSTGIPPCVAKVVSRPVRNREARRSGHP